LPTGVLIACAVHDNEQEEAGTKDLHAELQAVKTYLKLHDWKQELGITDQQIYIAAACVYNHTYGNACEAMSRGFMMPPLRTIIERAQEWTLVNKGKHLVEARPHLAGVDGVVNRVVNGQDYPGYPKVPLLSIVNASGRMRIADELDTMAPPEEGNIRTVMWDPNRHFWGDGFDGYNPKDELEERILGAGEYAPDDVTRSLVESKRFDGLRKFESPVGIKKKGKVVCVAPLP